MYKRFRIAFTTNVKHWIEETNFSKVTFMDEPDMKLSFLCTVIDYEWSSFFLRVSRASETRARVKITPR